MFVIYWLDKNANYTEIDNAKDIDVVMSMYNLIEYSDNYSNTSGGLWQYYWDDPANRIQDSESFKSNINITGNTPGYGNTKYVEIAAPLKCLSNFWRTLEMPSFNFEVNLKFFWRLCYFFCNWRNNIFNNRYKTLCSGCTFINRR